MRRGEVEEGTSGQPPSHTTSHQAKRKERNIEKVKSPEAKGRWDNLRIAGKKQAKLRPGTHQKE